MKFNINSFLWFLVLGLYSYLLGDMIRTGNINLYLHPKMTRYVYFAFGALILLTLYQSTRIFKSPYKAKFKTGILIFMLPLLLAFTVQPDGVSIKMAENKGIYVVGEVNKNVDLSQTIGRSPYKDENAPFYVSDFQNVLYDMYFNPKAYEGKTVQVMGFIYETPEFDQNTFMISRLVINCCTADAQVAGFKANWDQLETLNKEKWYLVEGQVRLETTYNPLLNMEETVTVIDVVSALEVNEPENPYIYP